MKDKKLLVGFVATVLLAILLRVFVVDVISVTNDILQPQFYPGDFVLVSKLSTIEEGQWILLKDYPKKSVYSIRRLVEPAADQGWNVLEPATELSKEEKVFVSSKQILGKAVMILWSLPCKPSTVANGQCPDKGSRFFKTTF